jgi:CRISPR-associated protein Csm1
VSRFAQEDSSLVCFNTHDLPVPSLPTRCDYVAGCGAPIQSFEELIDDDADFKRLGVLRMDVDNLGLLFRTLSSGDDALRRTATMSRRLDLFFKQELNELYMQHYSRSAVIIYSGGDDLFIVGEWTQTLAFAVAIHDHFTEAFRDTTLGLSGGVALVTAKYPIIRAAELSAAEEELSKRFVHGAARKNALSLFGIPMRWDVEFRAVWHCSEQLVDSIDAGAVDRSIIGRLQRYYANAHFEGQHLTPVRLIWLIGYDLSRLIGRNKRQEPLIRQYISDITTGSTLEGKYIDTPYHALQLLTVAARIAELRLRTSNR